MTPRAAVAMVGENKNEQEAKMFWIPLDPYRDENPFGPDAPKPRPKPPQ